MRKYIFFSLISTAALFTLTFPDFALAAFPHIDSISPTEKAAETAFTLKIDGVNFNSTLSKNRVQFRDVPWTQTKERRADRGSSTHLEFDIPSNFFTPSNARDWRVYVISDIFESDNYKVLKITATKTCQQLGGVLCPAGKICSVGKKPGASDGEECCAYEANCKEAAIYPHIDSISPTEKAAETAFELTISGTNFNPTHSQNRVKFEQAGISSKERSPKSGSASELKFDIPSNFFAPADAGEWTVYVSSYQGAWLLSDNYEIFTVNPSSKTCQQLGGVLCPPGKICSVGKKPGASDGEECCAYEANCVVAGGTAPPSGSSGPGFGIIILPNPLGEGTTLEILLNKITNFIFGLGMAVAPILLIIAGFIYVTSAGDPGRVGNAKKIMLYTVIGLTVLLVARGLVVVLKSIIGA